MATVLARTWPSLYVVLSIGALVWARQASHGWNKPWRLSVALAGAFLALRVFLAGTRHRRQRDESGWLTADIDPSPKERAAFSTSHFIGLIATTSAIAISWLWLEYRQPFYFNQDENFAQFQPVILEGARRAFQGQWFAWNPYQNLGSPVAGVGIYALTYPFTYLAYAISHFGLEIDSATLEIFALLHLLGGGAVLYLFQRQLGLRPALAFLAALSFELCGYNLIAGRSWYYMLPLCLWLPALFYGVFRLQKRWEASQSLSRGWVLGMAFSSALLFHAGNAQMWLYCMGFVSLAVAALALQYGLPSVTDLRALCATAAMSVGLCLPLALPQWFATQHAPRSSWGEGITAGLFSLLVPEPWIHSPLPNGWGSLGLERAGQFYYAGTLFTLVAFVALAALWYQGFRLSLVGKNHYLLLGALALLLAMGQTGGLWTWQSCLPVLSKFTNPFKFLPFLHFFFALGSAVILERVLRRSKHDGLWAAALTAAFLLAMAHHLNGCRTSFFTYGRSDYQRLPGELQALLKQGRVAPLLPEREVSRSYAEALPHNLPTYYRILSLWGRDHFSDYGVYEQARQTLTDPEALRQWGIRWILSDRSAFLPQHAGALAQESLAQAQRERLTRWTGGKPPDREFGDILLWQVPGAQPLAFLKSMPDRELPVHYTGSGMELALPQRAESTELIVAFLARPELKVFLNGQALALQPDPLGRIRLALDSGPGGHLEIRISQHWLAGFGIGSSLFLFSVLFLRTRPSRRKTQRK